MIKSNDVDTNKKYVVNRVYEVYSDRENLTAEEHYAIIEEIRTGIKRIENDLEYDYDLKISFDLTKVNEPVDKV